MARKSRANVMDRDRLYHEFIHDDKVVIKAKFGTYDARCAITAEEAERRNQLQRESMRARRDLGAEKREADIAFARSLQALKR